MKLLNSNTAKGIYMGLLMFFGLFLFRKVGGDNSWFWLACIIINFILIILLAKKILNGSD
ncbi:hypothetical protein CLV98_102478 [Dyadobacter jejuensis]|uniref:Uncharacterized protein n=1 Tax=Dyadobacter jejuensis TaxID=1082580 RepID=A0A316AR02_9BACT|nr:hypothetical protein CLV98_102478 [Dyadobacter jejuensis]